MRINMLSILLAMVMVQFSWGCASVDKYEARSGQARNHEVITFIDLDRFDKKMAHNVEHGVPAFDVLMKGDEVTLNNIPIRAQKWLSLVDEKGKGVEIENQSETKSKSLGLVLAVAPVAYRYLKAKYQNLIVSPYRAKIVLKEDSAKIDKLVFYRPN